MPSLFTSNVLENLRLPGADVSYLEQLDLGHPSDAILAALIKDVPWRHEDVVIQGKAYKQPRLTAWYGDAGTGYTYSGLSLDPLPWSGLLLELKARVEAATGTTFNSALLNLYRGNRDSIGFHSDNEPELGSNPTIASLSLGEERTFVMRHKRDKSIAPCKIPLASGSLLVMAGSTQTNWLHGVEKEQDHCDARVNITFRTIKPSLRRSNRFSR